MVNAGGTWWVDDRAQPAVTGAHDIDLSFTPATNLMPLRRLGTEDLPVAAAWLQYPQAKLVPLEQTYARTGLADVMRYRAEETDYSTDLTVDRTGFVTLYPGLWEGQVTHAS